MLPVQGNALCQGCSVACHCFIFVIAKANGDAALQCFACCVLYLII